MTTEASASGADQTQAVSDDKDAKGSVAYETYQKVLREKKNRDEQLRVAQEKLTEFERAKAEAEEAKLQEQGQFKQLLEKEQTLRKQTEEKLFGLQKGLENSLKRQSLEDKLGGRLKRQEYSSFIPFDRIAINPETMEIDEHSLAEVAQEFEKEHRALIDFKKTNQGVPPGTAPNSASKLTYDQWLKLPLKDQKSRMKDVIR